jgi:hypothetical protein
MLFARPNLHVLVIGLDYAGKTTMLEKIKKLFGNQEGIPPDKIPPTIGMNCNFFFFSPRFVHIYCFPRSIRYLYLCSKVAKVRYRGSEVIFWDLGGQVS